MKQKSYTQMKFNFADHTHEDRELYSAHIEIRKLIVVMCITGVSDASCLLLLLLNHTLIMYMLITLLSTTFTWSICMIAQLDKKIEDHEINNIISAAFQEHGAPEKKSLCDD